MSKILGESAYLSTYKEKVLVYDEIYTFQKVKLLNLTIKNKNNPLNVKKLLACTKSYFVIRNKEQK